MAPRTSDSPASRKLRTTAFGLFPHPSSSLVPSLSATSSGVQRLGAHVPGFLRGQGTPYSCLFICPGGLGPRHPPTHTPTARRSVQAGTLYLCCPGHRNSGPGIRLFYPHFLFPGHPGGQHQGGSLLWWGTSEHCRREPNCSRGSRPGPVDHGKHSYRQREPSAPHPRPGRPRPSLRGEC